ncbi:hypothetical protein PG985_009496 [Apiospora marii]|uniref:uncharacterized protein n=1 Tax=Apiospora marii TaxID=335849 RepID=UPI00313186FB
MVSRTVPADQQALAAQKSKIAAFAAWAGVYLVLATINGGLALVAKRGWPYSRSSFEGALAIVFLCELFFSVFLLFYISEPGPESRPSPPPIPGEKWTFAFVGGMLGLEAAILTVLFRVSDPNLADLSFWVFALFWLGFGAEFVYGPLAGAVDRAMAARTKQPAAK